MRLLDALAAYRPGGRRAFLAALGLPEPYEDTARRKIVPETLERRVLAAFDATTPLFRKTSCAVAYAHGLPNYNGCYGHYGIRELCDICPLSQLGRADQALRHPHPRADQQGRGRRTR
nr:hypothetical protein [Frankia sp. Cppng1_Ct_nod]